MENKIAVLNYHSINEKCCLDDNEWDSSLLNFNDKSLDCGILQDAIDLVERVDFAQKYVEDVEADYLFN